MAISPNGDYIVSGPHDHTVRIWDSASGTYAFTPALGVDNPMFDFLVGNGEGGGRVREGAKPSRCRGPVDGEGTGTETVGAQGLEPSRAVASNDCWVNALYKAPYAYHRPGAHRQTHTDTHASPPLDIPSWYGSRATTPTHPTPLARRQRTSSTGELRHTLQGHSDWVNAVAISPNGDYIVSGSYDETLRIWDSTSGTYAYAPALIDSLPAA